MLTEGDLRHRRDTKKRSAVIKITQADSKLVVVTLVEIYRIKAARSTQ